MSSNWAYQLDKVNETTHNQRIDAPSSTFTGGWSQRLKWAGELAGDVITPW